MYSYRVLFFVTDVTTTLLNYRQKWEQLKKEITDWRLTLANYENILPDDFEVEVEEID